MILERIGTQPACEQITTAATSKEVITSASIDDVITTHGEDGVIFASADDREPLNARERNAIQESRVRTADIARSRTIEATPVEPHTRACIPHGVVHGQVVQTRSSKNRIVTQSRVDGVVSRTRVDGVVCSEHNAIDDARLQDGVVAAARC